MDPVSIFNALYDTKCIKFGRYDLKSGVTAPYYINLRRLTLYPKLMEAIASQIYENFLSPQALSITISQLRRRRENRSTSTNSQIVESINQELKETLVKNEEGKKSRKAKNQSTDIGSDSDSQLGDEDDASAETSSDRDWDELSGEDARQNIIVSAVPYGAVPIANSIAFYAKIPFLFERKAAKSYGDSQSLVDDFRDGTELEQLHRKPKQRPTVILIEDFICSGESILEAVRNLEEQNLKVEFVICIVDREANGINLLLKQAGIRVFSLYKISAILRVLEVTGRIRADQFRSIRQWMVDNQFKAISLGPAEKPESPVVTERIEGNHEVQVAAN